MIAASLVLYMGLGTIFAITIWRHWKARLTRNAFVRPHGRVVGRGMDLSLGVHGDSDPASPPRLHEHDEKVSSASISQPFGNNAWWPYRAVPDHHFIKKPKASFFYLPFRERLVVTAPTHPTLAQRGWSDRIHARAMGRRRELPCLSGVCGEGSVPGRGFRTEHVEKVFDDGAHGSALSSCEAVRKER